MSLASLGSRSERLWPFGIQEVVCTRKPSASTGPSNLSRVPMVRAHRWCRGNFTAALLKDLARNVERNENPWNVIPVGFIHHRATAGSSEAFPKPQPCRPACDIPSPAGRHTQLRARLAGSRTADGWAQPVALGRAKPALKMCFRRPAGCVSPALGRWADVCRLMTTFSITHSGLGTRRLLLQQSPCHVLAPLRPTKEAVCLRA